MNATQAMPARARPFVAPAYLLLALLVGGAGSQSSVGNAILQLAALGLLLWAAIAPRRAMVPPMERRLGWLAAALVALVLLQLVPLPLALWTRLPGRAAMLAEEVGAGIAGPGWRPASLAPFATVDAALMLLPPLAMLAAMLKLGAYRQRWIAAALIGATGAAILLGTAQASAPGESSPFYLYRVSNHGVATGFFANANHMALLLLVSIPFSTATAAAFLERRPGRRAMLTIYALVGAALLLLLVGLALNGSLFGYALLLPVLVASLLMLTRPGQRMVRLSLLLFALLGALAMAAGVSGRLGDAVDRVGIGASATSRQTIFATSLPLVERAGPLGHGLGTYQPLYRTVEPRAQASRFFVNHAHDDYLEWIVETGWAGGLLGGLFLLWWLVALVRLRASTLSDQYAWAGGIASGTVLLHSLVDYPLRTASMSVLFAAALALMLQSRRHLQEERDLRPTRHVVVD